MKKVLLSLVLLCGLGHAYVSDFSRGPDGWSGAFTDFPVGDEAFFELDWGWEALPCSFRTFRKGLFIQGNNHSDDLFMFFKREFKGLEPNTVYYACFTLWIETNVPVSTFGIGGSPGESVYFKVGGSPQEPVAVDRSGFHFLNVDKGNQAQGGANAITIGDLANTQVDPYEPCYHPKSLRGSLPVTTDAEGNLWLFLGTDSGYEGFTRFYIAQIEVDLSR